MLVRPSAPAPLREPAMALLIVLAVGMVAAFTRCSAGRSPVEGEALAGALDAQVMNLLHGLMPGFITT